MSLSDKLEKKQLITHTVVPTQCPEEPQVSIRGAVNEKAPQFSSQSKWGKIFILFIIYFSSG